MQSAFCPNSFARTKTVVMEPPDTFSLGKVRARFSVSMRSLGIYMLLRDWTERKRPLTHCRLKLSTRSPASLWSLPPNSLSRYMTSMTMSPNLPRLSTVPVYLKCQTSVSEWKWLFLLLLLFEVHLRVMRGYCKEVWYFCHCGISRSRMAVLLGFPFFSVCSLYSVSCGNWKVYSISWLQNKSQSCSHLVVYHFISSIFLPLHHVIVQHKTF